MGKERNHKYPWSYLSEPGRLVLAATLAGVLAGVSACLLKYGVDWLGLHITSLFGSGYSFLSFLIFPFLGMLLAVWYQKGVGENLSHGTDIISRRLRDHRVRVPRNMMWTPVLGCLLTVGFGASAGAESPAALSGASIASRAGGWFRLPGNYVRILLACGAGAGIAGIFKSPVGGMLFTIEILRIEMSAVASISLVCSCMAAYTTAYVMSGFTWDVSFIPDAPFEPSRLGWILLLGLFCGFYSVYYRQTEKWVIRQLAKVRNIWKKALVAGAAVSLVVFLLPPMYGEGYKVVSGLVSGNANVLTMDSLFFSGETEAWILLLAVTAMLLFKGMAVGAVNYGGGVAGEFAPTLFAGALAGYLFATVLNMAFGLDLPVANFALIGMGAVMAGVIKAPLMAIFIAVEISDSYRYILGFIFAACASYMVVVLSESLWNKTPPAVAASPETVRSQDNSR